VVLLSVIIGCVSVVPVNPVVVRCGGLMLRRERHGRGGDVLLRELRLMDPGGGLSSSAIFAFYIRAWTVVHCFCLVLVERVSCCLDSDGHCQLSAVYGMCCRRLGSPKRDNVSFLLCYTDYANTLIPYNDVRVALLD
jgi:hypothetical protein